MRSTRDCGDKRGRKAYDRADQNREAGVRQGIRGSRPWAAAVAAVLCMALAGARPEAPTLRWARSIAARSLDPHAANTGPNLLIAPQIYEPLIVRQFDGKMLPALAA